MRDTKYQIFISSTFKDLKRERQAAVEAILTSQNIPAGMELFTANNEDQWKIIRRWIEVSDIYMLILGGRYGSIDNKTGKSYTQMEYEYAKELGKPIFALVVSDRSLRKLKTSKPSFIESSEPEKLHEFRTIVTSRMVEFYDDIKDIKISTFKAIKEMTDDNKLVGWIRADNTTSAQVAEELARLTRENNQLKKITETELFNGLSTEELKGIINLRTDDGRDAIEHFKKMGKALGTGFHYTNQNSKIYKYLKVFSEVGLTQNSPPRMLFTFTEEGRRFYLQLLKEEIVRQSQ